MQLPIDLGNPVSQSDLNRGLIHWYSGVSNGTGAKTFKDLIRQNDGTATALPDWVPEQFGAQRAVFLDGTNNLFDCGSAAAIGDVMGHTEFSCQAWVNSNTLSGGTSNLRHIALVGQAISDGTPWGMRQLTGGDKCQWFISSTVNTAVAEITGFEANKWLLLTGRYQQNTGVQLFLGPNGGAVQPQTNAMRTVTASMEIGSWGGSTGMSWSGMIADIRLFNRYLSDDEIYRANLEFNAGCPTIFNRYNPGKYWQFFPRPAQPVYTTANEVGVDDEFTEDIDPVYLLSNDVEVGDEFSGDSPYRLETDLDAEAATGGDIPSSAPAGTYILGTNVQVDADNLTLLTPGVPLVVSNIVEVGDDVDLSKREVYDTDVAVSDELSLFLGNSPNALVGHRYRR